jgi:hypothetical protein
MHARIDQLLSILDRDPVDAGVRQHVASCRDCAAAAGRLGEMRDRLRTLAPVEAKPDGWQALQSRFASHERAARRRVRVSRVVAVASVTAIAVLASLHGGGEDVTTRAPAAAPGTQLTPEQHSLATLLDRSRELEQALAAMPSRPTVERADTSIPIDAMEARVQWLDHRLSIADAEGVPAEDAERLWRERVEVLSSLVQLRYVEAQRVAL